MKFHRLSGPLLVTALPLEIIFDILQWLDPLNLLSLKATCRFFKNLASGRSLWLSYARREIRTRPLGLPLGKTLETATQEELVFSATRCALLRRLWRSAHPKPVGFTKILQLSKASQVDEIAFLPTGKHLMVLSDGIYLACYELEFGRCVSNTNLQTGGQAFTAWDSEETSTSTMDLILFSRVGTRGYAAIVAELSFVGGLPAGNVVVNELWRYHIPYENTGVWIHAGYFGVLVQLPSGYLGMLVINYHSHRSVLLQLDVELPADVDSLVHGDDIILHWAQGTRLHTKVYKFSYITSLNFTDHSPSFLEEPLIFSPASSSSHAASLELLDPNQPPTNVATIEGVRHVSCISTSWDPSAQVPFPVFSIYQEEDVADMDKRVLLFHHYYDPLSSSEVVKPLFIHNVQTKRFMSRAAASGKEVLWVEQETADEFGTLLAGTFSIVSVPLPEEIADDPAALPTNPLEHLVKELELPLVDVNKVTEMTYDDARGLLALSTDGNQVFVYSFV